ncbi:hypothetical protein AB3N04_19875 [Alkalihalophilus sp. As8PL]|uniref:Uncharacterized protein n=1 Tax=Alkalihalophilus sp. As8PL TaxID=3237103 RepID=A0AB39BYZ7_9BACI
MILYDLILVVFGIVLGVFIAEPLKNIFTGKHKEEARQKKRVKLLLAIRENKTKIPPTTEELAEKVFSGKLDIKAVEKLLKEVEDTGLIKGVSSKGEGIEKTTWVYVKKH